MRSSSAVAAPAPPSLAGRTVVYGGSFNPPHLGHAMACTYLLGRAARDVWMVPTWQHADGKQLIAFEHRFAMCERLAAMFGTRVQVRDDERRLGGIVQTADLVGHLEEAHPGRAFALAIGSDLVAAAPTWDGWKALMERVPLAVVPRGGHPVASASLLLPEISSTAVRGRCAQQLSLAPFVPEAVEDYIVRHQLYGR